MTELSDETRIRRALRGSFAVLVIGGILGSAIAFWLYREPDPELVQERENIGPKSVSIDDIELPPLSFVDITSTSGIDFVHHNGAYGERMLPESMGGGVAVLDFDNDDRQDVIFIDSNEWRWRPISNPNAGTKLYRNVSSGNKIRFDDMSHILALPPQMYGMGVASGDYDGDGWVDLFISAVGSNYLLRNVGGRKFVDVTSVANVGGSEKAWSTSAAFFDYDRDGDLDLFVCNYVQWSPEINRQVDYRLTGIGRAYGPPTDFAGTDSYLYRNDNGIYTDVSEEAGIRVGHETSLLPVGKGLAVLATDVNNDHWLDIVVANDTVRNFLFLNNQNGSFEEVGIEQGLAFDSGGLSTGAMGIDAAYYANDDRLAITIGNFANEMSSFYVARPGKSIFSDDAIVAGVGAKSRRALTFGTFFADLDLDGRLDLVAANGHVEPEINRVQSSQEYEQRIQLFWNCGADCSRDYVLAPSTVGLDKPRVGRGLVYSDFDADGDLDIVVTQINGSAAIFRNDLEGTRSWVRLKLETEVGSAIGTEVSLLAGGTTQKRLVMPSRSYLSQVELPITFGLGSLQTIDRIEVRWPNGQMESWVDLEPNRMHTIIQNTGFTAR